MTRKANKTTTGWRKRYLVNLDGYVWLLRGKGKKSNRSVHYQVHVDGRWVWLDIGDTMVVETEAQLVALRLQGMPIRKEPRWKHYSQ